MIRMCANRETVTRSIEFSLNNTGCTCGPWSSLLSPQLLGQASNGNGGGKIGGT
jgi:hypothetical protein